jgi:hypothetical protein
MKNLEKKTMSNVQNHVRDYGSDPYFIKKANKPTSGSSSEIIKALFGKKWISERSTG